MKNMTMKTLYSTLVLCVFGLLCVCCQQKKGQTTDGNPLPSLDTEWHSVAQEINTLLDIAARYYPEEEDTLYYEISNRIDSLTGVYVDKKIKSLTPVRPVGDVMKHLSSVSETLFDDEDWLGMEDLEKYRESLVLLQKYIDAVNKGNPATYPYAETQHVLHEFMEKLSMENSEGSEYPDIHHLLYYRYLQQVLAWCPDMRKMATMMTSDERAAILTVGDCIYQTYAKPLLLKDSNGNWIPVIYGDRKPNHVYSFEYGDRMYYLFSEHGAMERYGHYSCTLYMYENNQWQHIDIKDYDQTLMNWYTKKVLQTEGDVQYVETWDAYITFNPKEKRWNFCYEKDGIYYPHPGSKTLYLDIDAKNGTTRLRLANEY